ncbi:MAG: hypothetical protein RL518_1145 [Pseudomonadota bacterium]
MGTDLASAEPVPLRVKLGLLLFGSLSGIVLAIFAVEAYHFFYRAPVLEWHDPNTVFDPNLAWRPVAHRRVEHSWGTISANAEGYRAPPLDLGRKQVVLLGDSVAWGYGVGDADTLSYILEPGLKPHGVQLSNLAVSGYGFDQYLLRLQENLPLLSKQLAGIVLIICAQNDYQNTIRNSIFGKRKMLFRQRGADIQLTDWPVSRYSLRNLLSDSFIITKASDASESFRNAIHSIAGDIELTEPEAKIVVLSVLRKIIEVARDLRVPMTIILSPDRLDFPEPRSRYVNFQNVLDEAGISYIDYRRVIQEKGFNVSGIYHDRLHYTPEGNRYLADVVRERLSEAGVIPHGG